MDLTVVKKKYRSTSVVSKACEHTHVLNHLRGGGGTRLVFDQVVHPVGFNRV